MKSPLSPHYTTHPIFPDMVSAMLVALLISVGMNFAFAMLRKKTTDIEKMSKVMKETNEWRKQYTDAIKKQQQQMRPMFLYMIPSFLIWIFVFPTIFGATVSLSPIYIPWITCSDQNVQTDTQPKLDGNGQPVTNPDGSITPNGSCRVPGQVYLWGWFLLSSFSFSGIISKVTKTNMPSITG